VAEEESADTEELISWSNGHRITPTVDEVEEVALIPCKQDWFSFRYCSTCQPDVLFIYPQVTDTISSLLHSVYKSLTWIRYEIEIGIDTLGEITSMQVLSTPSCRRILRIPTRLTHAARQGKSSSSNNLMFLIVF
jgi:hypothetical protein